MHQTTILGHMQHLPANNATACLRGILLDVKRRCHISLPHKGLPWHETKPFPTKGTTLLTGGNNYINTYDVHAKNTNPYCNFPVTGPTNKQRSHALYTVYSLVPPQMWKDSVDWLGLGHGLGTWVWDILGHGLKRKDRPPTREDLAWYPCVRVVRS